MNFSVKKRNFGLAVCLILFTFLCAACSKKSSSNYSGQKAPALKESKMAARGYNSAVMTDTAYFDNVEYEMAEESVAASEDIYQESGYSDQAASSQYERKLIRTGNVTLEVQTLSEAEDKIAAWAKSLGGFVTNASTWEMGANFTVRIPSERFDDAMSQVGTFGRVTNRNVSSQDVSDNYYDLQARLNTKYILRDKLNSYLSQAKDIKDLLEIERQLNKVLEDIDSTESRFKRLAGQVDYSTIYVNMQFERGKDEGGVILPDFKNAWNEILSKIIAFFWGLLKLIFYIIIFGLPLTAICAFFFWLLFGKVGLLVKLFKKLKK